jgi:hypothetical protein
LYSSFLTDQYIVDDSENDGDSLIVFMDNDAMFFSPVTLSSILDEYNRPRVLGSDCSLSKFWVSQWATAAHDILGFPMVVDFMSYFPAYIYADTIRNCRQYLMTRFGGNVTGTNTATFEDLCLVELCLAL